MSIFLLISSFWAAQIQKAYAMLRQRTLTERQILNIKNQIENSTSCLSKRILLILEVRFIDRNQMTSYTLLREECNITSKINYTRLWLTLISFYSEAQNWWTQNLFTELWFTRGIKPKSWWIQEFLKTRSRSLKSKPIDLSMELSSFKTYFVCSLPCTMLIGIQYFEKRQKATWFGHEILLEPYLKLLHFS